MTGVVWCVVCTLRVNVQTITGVTWVEQEHKVILTSVEQLLAEVTFVTRKQGKNLRIYTRSMAEARQVGSAFEFATQR